MIHATKHLQIAMMPQIYSGALLTISAQRAASADEGLLERDVTDCTDFSEDVFELPWLRSNRSVVSVTLFRLKSNFGQRVAN